MPRWLYRAVIAVISLIVLSGFAASIYAFKQGILLSEERSKLESQRQSIEKLSQEVKTVRYGTGNLYNTCINDATTKYSNYVKTNGNPMPTNDGATSYSLDAGEWKFADDQLAKDRDQCQRDYGNQ